MAPKFRPRAPPANVVPIDLLAKGTSRADSSRKKGRPTKLPIKANAKTPASQASRSPARHSKQRTRKKIDPDPGQTEPIGDGSFSEEEIGNAKGDAGDAQGEDDMADDPSRLLRSLVSTPVPLHRSTRTSAHQPSTPTPVHNQTPRLLVANGTDSESDPSSPPTDSPLPMTPVQRRITTHSEEDHSAYEQWSSRYHDTKDLHLVADLGAYSEESAVVKRISPPSSPAKTPGVEVTGFLRPLKTIVGDNSGYERREVNMKDLQRVLDRLPHDYNLDTHRLCQHASFEWLDGPGLYPSDVRARRVSINLDPRYNNSPSGKVIWRVIYNCNNLCRKMETSGRSKNLPALASSDVFGSQLFEFAEATVQRKKAHRQRNESHISDSVVEDGDESDEANSIIDQGTDGHSTGDEEIQTGDDEVNNETDEMSPGSLNDDDVSEVGESGSDSEESSPSEEHTPVRRSKRQANPERTNLTCDAKLIIEMIVGQSQLGNCSIFLKRDAVHPPVVNLTSLRISPYMRRLLHEAASGFGMTQGRLTAWYLQHISTTDTHAQWLASNCPHRLPTVKDYRTAIQTAQNKSRVDKSYLVAIEILSKRHPEAFLASRYPSLLGETTGRQANKGDRFECVIASPFSLVTAILQVFRKGMYMDSSWRNKNAFRCPLTLLVTINEYHRMIPVAAMVSNYADEEAYSFFLSAIKKAIVKLAREIIEDRVKIKIDGVTASQLKAACNAVIEDGLLPAFAMIDGDDAERRAIEHEFPDTPIRVCQFHFMQACRSRARRVFSQSAEREVLASSFLEALRRCQRCPSSASWALYYHNLEDEVNELAQDDGEAWEEFDRYLKKEWFSDRWRPYLIDYGLPPHVSRDGPWSTNNYSEAAFRTFDRVFLGCRANKRLDRLIAILVNAYFPFYENVPQLESRPSAELERAIFGGLHRWEVDCVRPCPRDNVPPQHRRKFVGTVYCVLPPRRDQGKRPHYCGRRGRKGQFRDFCTCTGLEVTGKRCAHLWAMATYELCGPVMSFEENASTIRAFLSRTRNYDEHRPIQIEDDLEDFQTYWREDFGQLAGLSTLDLGGADSVTLIEHPVSTSLQYAQQEGKDKSVRFGKSEPIRKAPTPIGDSEPDRRLTTTSRKGDEWQTSPIGRRYQTGNRDDSPPDTVTDLADLSKNMPGRPSNIRPLHPYRTTKKKEVRKEEDDFDTNEALPAWDAFPTFEDPLPDEWATSTAEATVPASVPVQQPVPQPVQSIDGILPKQIFPSATPAAPTDAEVDRQSVKPRQISPERLTTDVPDSTRPPNTSEGTVSDFGADVSLDQKRLDSVLGVKPVNHIPQKRVKAGDEAVKHVEAPTVEALPISGNTTTVGPVHDPPPGYLPTRKRQRSSLGLSDKVTNRILFPIGAKNTGLDCYALSLFQVLVRQPLWLETIRSPFATQTNNSVIRLLRSFSDEIEAGRTSSYPYLRPVLKEHGLIDSADTMDDPLQLLARLTPYLDEQLGGTKFRDLFKFEIDSQYECPYCREVWQVADECQTQNTLILRPQAARGFRPQFVSMFQEGLETGSERQQTCPNAACGKVSTGRSTQTFSSNAPILSFNVGWDAIRPSVPGEGTGGGNIAPVRSFTTPLRIELDSHGVVMPYSGDTAEHVFDLSGIICRIGRRTETGHYIAIIRHDGKYFEIDDDRVSWKKSPSVEAFRDGKYPVFIVYERASKTATADSDAGQVKREEADGSNKAVTSGTNPLTPLGDTHADNIEKAPLVVDTKPAESLPIEDLSLPNPSNGQAVDEVSQDPQEWPLPHSELFDSDHRKENVFSGELSGEIRNQVFSSDWSNTFDYWTGVYNPPFPELLASGAQPIDLTGADNPPSLYDVIDFSGEGGVTRPSSPTSSTDSIDLKKLMQSSHDTVEPPSQDATSVGDSTQRKSERKSALKKSDRDNAQQMSDRESILQRTSDPNQAQSMKSRPIDIPFQVRFASTSDDQIRSIMDRYKSWGVAEHTQALVSMHELGGPGHLTIPPLSRAPLFSNQLYDILARRIKANPNGPGLFRGIIKVPKAELSVQTFLGLKHPTGWWRDDFIDAVCLATVARIARSPSLREGNGNEEVRYAGQLLRYNDSTRRPMFIPWGSRPQRPWPGLGIDASWRQRTTVSVISASYQTHFVTLAIFGPKRLVIPFDGAGGAYDDPYLRDRWPTLLVDRLIWEQQQGLVTPEQNEGWIFASNTTHLRDQLGWVHQYDGYSCGPFAVAAAIMMLQNIRPTARALRTAPTGHSSRAAEWLRLSIIMIFLEEAEEEMRRSGSDGSGWLDDVFVQIELDKWRKLLDSIRSM
ncbi:hypothetical protein BCR39DRAFT_556578 [Naematelia encephala]|uniref:USP domain-containing protein n=1 Tax=Naematelia encephala TaxID=71784 RepID=A0A1Y2BKC3_9TREE|nr:hypothetical protein BCR39DRAFT_556578 [Naematelia encephala]